MRIDDRPRRWILPTLVITLSTFTLALAAEGMAQSRNDSGSARLSVAGKLRLEAEVVNRLACEAVSGNGSEKSIATASLAESEAQVRSLMSALKDGNLALGLREPEAKRRVVDELVDVDTAWRDVRSAVDTITGGTANAAALEAVLTTGETAKTAIEDLVAVLAGSYSNSETFSYQASLAMNVLVREKVILAEIATLQCLIASGIPSVAGPAQLALVKQAGTFEKSLEALTTGQPAIGLMAPPSDAVKSTLETVATLWNGLKVSLAGGGDLSGSADMMRELENAEILYLLATSAQPDLYRVPLEAYASEQLRDWLREPLVAQAISFQNIAHAALTQEQIDQMDQTWRAERKSGDHKMIAEMMARPLSDLLKSRQDATAGIVTEVFVMDNKGLNVGQSAITSDLWQGDEDKWQLTYDDPQGEMHISDVEFDDSTGFYQVQVSIPISDPGTGDRIGAVTFGVNIQSLL